VANRREYAVLTGMVCLRVTRRVSIVESLVRRRDQFSGAA